MAIITFTYAFGANLNLVMSHDKVSGEVIGKIVNSANQNVIVTFTAEQLEKLMSLYKDFTKLRNTNDLTNVSVV